MTMTSTIFGCRNVSSTHSLLIIVIIIMMILPTVILAMMVKHWARLSILFWALHTVPHKCLGAENENKKINVNIETLEDV